LWPHLSTQIINDVLSNKIDISKLHLLLPLEYALISNDEIEVRDDSPMAMLAQALGSGESTDTRTMKLSKIAKSFPSPAHWIAVLSTWMGIKTTFGSRQVWGASVAMHISQIGRLNYMYGWQALVNYEISFFARYQTIDNPETTWAQEDPDFQATFLHTILERRRFNANKRPSQNQSSTRNGAQPSIYCHRFNNNKDGGCQSRDCKYLHRCSLDPTRCTASHPAAKCPLARNSYGGRQLNERISHNPNNLPLGDRLRDESPPPQRRRPN
jgi:hypothetical protein